ncbi:MAG: polysaccharide biosynthesis tyrosine autokinase [Phycisphaerales bacterium]|nr:polysaccharide biosynthesis tyrosine autokinase [Phycisphaerales bacterium]
MSQTLVPAAAPARASATDAPDIIFVLRRYLWLLIAGALIGTIIGGGLFLWLLKTRPQYTARVVFQVLGPPRPPTAFGASSDPTISGDDVNRFIKRQVQYIVGDTSSVLTRALQVEEFTSSRWFRENSEQPKDALRDAIDVSAIPLSDLFTIGFTCSDPRESKILVDALASIYQNNLRTDNALFNTSRIEGLTKSLDKQRSVVMNKEQQLADFRRSRDLDAMGPRRALQVKVLDELNTRVVEAQAIETTLKTNVENIKKQVEAGTFTLPSQEVMAIENDPQLRSLLSTKLALDQEIEVARRTTGVLASTILNLQTRINVVAGQIADRRDELTRTATTRVQADSELQHNAALARLQWLDEARKAKNAEIQDMDVWLVMAQRMIDEIADQKVILSGIQRNVTEEDLKRNTDDTRINKFSGPAVVPSIPSSPIWYKWWVPAGFVIGLGLSFGAVYLFELTNTRVRTPMDITRTLQIPLLGFVPDKQDDSALTGDLSTSIRTAPNSMIAESFRQIRGRLVAQADGVPVKTLLVASIAPGGGSTTVASNIANSMTLNETRVLLVDANFYRPGLARIYKNLPVTGLADVVATPSLLDSAIVESDQMPGLYVMSTGNITNGTASELLESRAFRQVVDQLKASYDVVIFDGAPLSLVSDSITLGSRVDGVIAVVRAGEVSRGTVARVREQLRHVKARLMGVVLNAAQIQGAGYFKQNYRTFYEYSAKGKRSNNTPTSVN